MATQATRMLLLKISNPSLLHLSSVSRCQCLSPALNQAPETHLFFPTQLPFNIPLSYPDGFSGLKEMMGRVEAKRCDSDNWSREKLEEGSAWEDEDDDEEEECDWDDSDFDDDDSNDDDEDDNRRSMMKRE